MYLNYWRYQKELKNYFVFINIKNQMDQYLLKDLISNKNQWTNTFRKM